jgi:cytoskeletal protein RodZ
MRIFPTHSKPLPDVPTELQAYYESAHHKRHSRRERLIAIVGLIVMVVLIVLVSRFVWHTAHTSKSTVVPSTKSQVNQPPSQNNEKEPTGTPAQTPASNTTNTK